MQAAEATKKPLILQASAGAPQVRGRAYLRHLVLAALEAHPDLPVVLASGSRRESVGVPAGDPLGLTSVMMDGSLLPDQKTPRLRIQRRSEPPRGGGGARGGCFGGR